MSTKDMMPPRKLPTGYRDKDKVTLAGIDQLCFTGNVGQGPKNNLF